MLEAAAPLSRVKHSTTEPLLSLKMKCYSKTLIDCPKVQTNRADPDQTSSEEAVWSGSFLSATLTNILWIPALITNSSNSKFQFQALITNILFENREKCMKFTTFSKINSSYLPLQIFDKSLWKLYEYCLWFQWLWRFFPGKSHPICWF